MMKRIALFALCLFVVTGSAFAQKKNVTGAAIELKKPKPDYEKAKQYLESAAQDPSTQDYPKTWYLMSKMYMQMQFNDQYKDQLTFKNATDACFKLISLDPGYESAEINNILINSASLYYNESVALYNNKDYKGAMASAQKVIDIHDLEGGKRFASMKSFDTTATSAKQIAAFAAYFGKDQAAIPALEKLVNDPIYSQTSAYSFLAEAYMSQNQNEKAIATIDKGRAAHPDDKQLRIDEINYYIKTGQQDVFVKKLEDAVAADPNNAELNFFLGQSYAELANPAKGDKPANQKELMDKAEAAYQKAVSIDGDNITYLYNFAAYYFNQTVPLIDEMNSLGTTAADDKKYEELNKQVKALYTKAMPNFQKAYDILEPKSASLNAEDKSTLINCIMALREIHARNNNLDEAKALKAKMDALRAQ